MLKYISAPIHTKPQPGEYQDVCGPFSFVQTKANVYDSEQEALSDAKHQCLKSTNPYGVYQLITEVNPPEVKVTTVTQI